MNEVNFFEDIKPEMMQRILDTNVYQYAMMLKLCLPILNKRSKPSGLIAISSVSAITPLPGMLLYAATKAFVNHLVLSVRSEPSSGKIDVLCSMPSVTATNILRDSQHATGIKRIEELTAVTVEQ